MTLSILALDLTHYLPLHHRKAVHATVVLLPLFGLHWLLTLYNPQRGANCIWKTFYKYLNVVLDGLQGLMVSFAFCYRNGEVNSETIVLSQCTISLYVSWVIRVSLDPLQAHTLIWLAKVEAPNRSYFRDKHRN